MNAGTPERLFANKRVLVLTPDATRSCPLPMMLRAVHRVMGRRCAKLDFMVALGTHPIMPEEKILETLRINSPPKAGCFFFLRFLNHNWDLAESFTRIGFLTEDEVEPFRAVVS